ncbi:unnamed protein product [Coregonus sp. 'balchen']|nr:unnamed protein product [Coregonus sp. 'balchen']
MREVFSSKAQSTFAALKTGCARTVRQMGLPGRRSSSGDVLGGSNGASSVRLRPRSCSLERILDVSPESDSCSRLKLFQSTESLASCKSNNGSKYSTPPQNKTDSQPDSFPNSESQGFVTMATPPSCDTSSADITMKPDSSSTIGLRGPNLLKLRASSMDLRPEPSVSRRCQSSLDLSRPTLALPSVSTYACCRSPEQSLLQPQLEQVAIEALQLCTLLLPPASRRKLQLLMRMISRMSQNVDLPRLHDAIATHTLMVHMFSHCMLGCEEEMDLDELLATRLVSFLMDHHQEILQVPVYLQNAVQDHIVYLRKVQVQYCCRMFFFPLSIFFDFQLLYIDVYENYEPVLFPLLDKIPGSVGAPVPVYSFCRRISTKEFEEQKLSVSQAAIADLLESLVKDKNMSMKDRKKNLKQFQRQYPDIYARHFPTTVLAAK